MRRGMLAFFIVLTACDPPLEEAEPAPARVRPQSPEMLLPLSIGDRWRERVTASAHKTRGVTAHTLEGLAVVMGQGDVRPTFYRADASVAALVDPRGHTLEPLLRAPLRAGARWSYSLGEGAIAARCEAEVVDDAARTRIAGASLERCVRVARRCVHPAGVVFEAETTRQTEETYCPGVGRVRVRQTLDPPLAGAAAVSQVELLTFRVAGGPVLEPQDTFDCDGFLLLPSDVAAACGPEWRFLEERRLDDGCAHRFASDEAVLEVRVSRRADAPAAAAALESLLAASGAEAARIGATRVAEREGARTLGATSGAHLVVVQTDGCPADRAARIVPFVGSLLVEER